MGFRAYITCGLLLLLSSLPVVTAMKVERLPRVMMHGLAPELKLALRGHSSHPSQRGGGDRRPPRRTRSDRSAWRAFYFPSDNDFARVW